MWTPIRGGRLHRDDSVVTALTGPALLNCDPELGEMRAGNALLYAVVALLLLGCFYLVLKPRVEPP